MSATEKVIATDDVKEKYTNILKGNGIQNSVKEVLISSPDLKGDHLGSTCDYVTVKFEDGSEDLDLFVKKKIEGSPMMTAMLDAMMLFDKESGFFNSFLPDAKKLCKNRLSNANLVGCFPKSYYSDNTCVVLENLSKRQYIMRDKSELQNLEEAKTVLRNMAKFHGVSYVMISELGLDKFIAAYPMSARESCISMDMEQMFGSLFPNNIFNCCKILQSHPQEDIEETVEWLKMQAEDLFPRLCQVVGNGPNDTLLALNHGDCWNNNMMFLKDPKSNEIIDHKFVDLQVTRCGSPNLDISFFLFTSVKSDVRQEHLESLLHVYFDTFKETISALKGNLNISFEEFFNDYKKKCFYGFVYGINMKTAIGAIKDVDNNACGTDVEEMKNYFNQVIENWIKKNYDITKDITKDVIGSVKEYKTLTENQK